MRFAASLACAALISLAGCAPPSPVDTTRGAWTGHKGSCAGYCGKRAPQGCWCDEACAVYGDCCPDVVDACEVRAESHCVHTGAVRVVRKRLWRENRMLLQVWDALYYVACTSPSPKREPVSRAPSPPANPSPSPSPSPSQSPSPSASPSPAGNPSPSPSSLPSPSPNPATLECFYNWVEGGCPAPIITSAYLGDNCAGGPGLFVIGQNFQSPALFDSTNDYVASGPWLLASPPTDFNVLSPGFMCVTADEIFGAIPSEWAGVIDQRGKPRHNQISSSAVVQNLLNATPPLVSSGSNDPFDPAACLDPAITQADAQALYAATGPATLGTASWQLRSRAFTLGQPCGPWQAASVFASGTAGLTKSFDGAHFTLDGVDCGAVGSYANTCSLFAGYPALQVHVATHCAEVLLNRERTSPSLNQYTETERVWLLRY